MGPDVGSGSCSSATGQIRSAERCCDGDGRRFGEPVRCRVGRRVCEKRPPFPRYGDDSNDGCGVGCVCCCCRCCLWRVYPSCLPVRRCHCHRCSCSWWCWCFQGCSYCSCPCAPLFVSPSLVLLISAGVVAVSREAGPVARAQRIQQPRGEPRGIRRWRKQPRSDLSATSTYTQRHEHVRGKARAGEETPVYVYQVLCMQSPWVCLCFTIELIHSKGHHANMDTKYGSTSNPRLLFVLHRYTECVCQSEQAEQHRITSCGLLGAFSTLICPPPVNKLTTYSPRTSLGEGGGAYS